MDAREAYWLEAVTVSFCDHGVKATAEQIAAVAGDVEVCAENMSMAFGTSQIESPYKRELEETKAALEAERRKVVCPECNGSGRIVTYGPVHSYDSECFRCCGEGKVSP